jgi:hypothetical protein
VKLSRERRNDRKERLPKTRLGDGRREERGNRGIEKVLGLKKVSSVYFFSASDIWARESRFSPSSVSNFRTSHVFLYFGIKFFRVSP